MSKSLWPPRLQNARLLCPSLSLKVCWNSYSLSVMLSIYLTLCLFLLFLPSIFPSIRAFFNEAALHIRWPKCWSYSFSISPSNIIQDWSPLWWTSWISLQSKGLLRVFPNTTIGSINSLAVRLLYGPTLPFIHDCWRNHSFDYTDVCWQSGIFAFLICCLGWS